MFRLSVLVSIHDVMPETLDAVERTLAACRHIPPASVLLLVVPGRQWSAADLARLRAWEAKGYPMAGHGWRHHVTRPMDWRHRLHSALISRNAAEHLSRSEVEIADLLQDCRRWFVQHEIDIGPVYVPPAWALGSISPQCLHKMPFRFYETLTGIIDAQTGRFHVLPLAGFEADTIFRAIVLRLSNGLNRALARLTARPLRISIHPYDLDYRLREALIDTIQGDLHFLPYTLLERSAGVIDWNAVTCS
ncbi:MAG: polysaccharide deacetylase family protein [Candidatus Hydrogenedentes bacterium]|nr:polysaccharide deacetylase family protein [Candidatus Hydrogenedentota bacterium]